VSKYLHNALAVMLATGLATLCGVILIALIVAAPAVTAAILLVVLGWSLADSNGWLR